MHGDKAIEAAKNIREREVAVTQILNHVRAVITPSMPMVKSLVVGGDFNTNLDQPDFRDEKTLLKLTEAGFRNPLQDAPLLQRITHPGSGRYPAATFDYLFGANMISARPQISPSHASDHYPVTCDFVVQATMPQHAQSAAAAAPNKTALAPNPAPVPQFATITQPVRIKIPYGETVLPRGLKLAVISRDAQSVTVSYLNGTQIIPIASTDIH